MTLNDFERALLANLLHVLRAGPRTASDLAEASQGTSWETITSSVVAIFKIAKTRGLVKRTAAGYYELTELGEKMAEALR